MRDWQGHLCFVTLTLHAVDWSQEQLEKHEREIMSMLGNTLLRVTSPALNKKLSESTVDPPSREELPEVLRKAFPGFWEPEDAPSLAQKFDQAMQELHIGDALDLVLDRLRAVRNLVFKSPMQHAYSPCQANELLTQEAPFREDAPADRGVLVRLAVQETLRVCGILLRPFVPIAAERLLDGMRIPSNEQTMEFADLGLGRHYVPKANVKLFVKRRYKNSSVPDAEARESGSKDVGEVVSTEPAEISERTGVNEITKAPN